MISPRMSRPVRVLLITSAAAAVAVFAAACGTQKISVPKSDTVDHEGAVLFSQRCSGCHTLSYAGAHGSAVNARQREITNGPNFDVRCERPITRVLYAIENGGFSGAIMPQNVVVGPQARGRRAVRGQVRGSPGAEDHRPPAVSDAADRHVAAAAGGDREQVDRRPLPARRPGARPAAAERHAAARPAAARAPSGRAVH